MFISELFMMKAMVASGNYLLLAITVLLLSFVLYALFIRVMHILFSKPLEKPLHEPGTVNPWQSVTQYLLFGMVILVCFTRPQPFDDLIRAIIQHLPQ